ncbi:MAG: NmrA family transcriptional regulator [Phycisphaerae bacterium]|nr:NmrA family transcriptional regulator [Phycisphaerae bacterium]
MKIVVIGGTGLIGSRVVSLLSEQRHEAIAASPSTGVNTVTAEGLAESLSGASVVIDVSNAPTFEPDAVRRFFETSTSNILAAAEKADVSHVVLLSIVGADRLPENGYLSAKAAQERLITDNALPYTIVRATQFFEFAGAIADASTSDGKARLSPAMMRPIAANDVAAHLVSVALEPPRNETIDLAGPEPIRMTDFARRYLSARGDAREIVADPDSRYFGSKLDDQSLVPSAAFARGQTGFDQWLNDLTPVQTD